MAKQPATRKRTATSKVSKPSRRASTKKMAAAKLASNTKQKALANARQAAYLAAVRLYEKALEKLQRRQFRRASASFQQVIDKFPEERELHERSRRYLQVCERESRPAPVPKTMEDKVYAATLALNAGSQDEALRYLEAVAKQEPDSDHVHYMLAVARADGGDTKNATSHLLRSIELNPDNRFIARQEQSFELLRENEAIREALKPPPAESPPRGTGR